MERPRRLVVYFALAGAALLSVCWVTGLGTPGMFNFPRPFSADVWSESTGTDDNARCAMMLDLRHRVGIVGKSREVIEQLLGPPDYGRADTTQYYICPLFPVDVHVLEILWADDQAVSVLVTNS